MSEKLRSGLLLSIFIVLSFGQLLRISLFDCVAFFPHEILMILYCIATSPNIKKLIEKKEYQRILATIGILITVFGLSLGFEFWKYSQVENFIGFLYFLRLILYLVFFISLLSEDKKKIKQGLTIFTVLTILFSYSQYILYPNLRNLSYLGWDPHQYRAFGLFFDTTMAGVIYMTLVFVELGKSKRNFLILGALMGLILLSYSRITY